MKLTYIAILVLAAFTFCACSTPPSPSSASTVATPTATVSALSTTEMEKMLIDIEKKSWEPVKNQSPEEAKRLNAPGYRATYFGAIHDAEESANDTKDIVIKSLSFSDWKVSFPVKDTAIVTYKYDAKASYKGKDTSGSYCATTAWVNIGGEWKQAVYAESKAEPQPKK